MNEETNETQTQKLEIPDFAKRIKEKYADYADLDDYELTERIVRKYPVYANQVNLPPDFRLLQTSSGYKKLDDLYEQTGREENVDPNLLLEQARQETDFRADVLYGRTDSPKGARGAGQFMPGTAPLYGLKVGEGVDERTNPIKSIRAQAKYMRKLLDQFDNDESLALAGYNAGEHRKSLREGRIPNIPETQKYVASVLEKLKAARAAGFTLRPPQTPTVQPAPVQPTGGYAGTVDDLVRRGQPWQNPDQTAVPGPTVPGTQVLSPAVQETPLTPPAPNDLYWGATDEARKLQTRPRIVEPPPPGQAIASQNADTRLPVKPGKNRKPKEPEFGVSVEVATDFQPVDDSGKPIARQQELLPVKSEEEAVERGSAGVARIDVREMPDDASLGEWGLRKALETLAPEYGLTDADIERGMQIQRESGKYSQTWDNVTKEQALADIEQGGNRVKDFHISKRLINDILNARTGSTGINEDVQTRLREDQAQLEVGNRDLRASQIRADERDEIRRELQEAELEKQNATPLSDPTRFGQNLVNPYQAKEITDAEIDAEVENRKWRDNVARNLGELLQNSLVNRGQARIVGGMVGGVGRLAETVGGIARPLSSLGIGSRRTYNTLKNIGQDARILSNESAKNMGFLGETLNMAGGAIVDVPKIIGMTGILGGNAVLAMGVDMGAQSSGRGDDLRTVGKEAIKGAMFGALFTAGSKLGKLAEQGFLKTVLPASEYQAIKAGAMNASPDVALASKVLGEGTRIGTVTGGTFMIEKADGKSTDEALKSAILNAILDVALNGQKFGEIADLAGKTFRLYKNGKPNDVTIDADGGVKLLKGGVPDEVIDAEIILDPKSDAYDTNQPEPTREQRMEAAKRQAEESERNQPTDAESRAKAEAEIAKIDQEIAQMETALFGLSSDPQMQKSAQEGLTELRREKRRLEDRLDPKPASPEAQEAIRSALSEHGELQLKELSNRADLPMNELLNNLGEMRDVESFVKDVYESGDRRSSGWMRLKKNKPEPAGESKGYLKGAKPEAGKTESIVKSLDENDISATFRALTQEGLSPKEAGEMIEAELQNRVQVQPETVEPTEPETTPSPEKTPVGGGQVQPATPPVGTPSEGRIFTRQDLRTVATKDGPFQKKGTEVDSTEQITKHFAPGDRVTFFAERERMGTWNGKEVIEDGTNLPWGVVGILASSNKNWIKKIPADTSPSRPTAQAEGKSTADKLNEFDTEGRTKGGELAKRGNDEPLMARPKKEVPNTAKVGKFETGKPITFDFIRNTEKSPNFGSRFGQDIEPAGRYLIEKPEGFKGQERWEEGKVTFKNPLVIDWGAAGYADADNWKQVLAKHFGKKGKALSRAIANAGYDGIVTVRGGETSEIVDLTGFQSSRPDDDDALMNRPKTDDRNLIVAHNLTERSLGFTDKLGGLAMPSLAITTKDSGFEGYGEITLIADKSLADPKNKVPVTDADMYSPRYPEARYDVDSKKFQNLWKDVSDNWKKRYGEDAADRYGMETEVRDRGDKAFFFNPEFTAYFLDQKGLKVPSDPKDLWSAAQPHRSEFEAFAQEKAGEISKGLKYFDGFTYSGNKRFKPYTLESVVKKMKSEMKSGEGFNYGAGNVRSKGAKRFKSIEQIQKSRDRIVSAKQLEADKERMNKKLLEVADKAARFYKFDSESFGYYDQFTNALADGLQNKRLRRELEEYGFENISPEVMGEITDYIDELVSLPTEYFEAKPQRAVGLNEFQIAVIPKDASQKTREILHKAGVRIYTYDRDVKGDRQRAIDEATGENDDILFQKPVKDERKRVFIDVKEANKASEDVVNATVPGEKHATWIIPPHKEKGTPGKVVGEINQENVLKQSAKSYANTAYTLAQYPTMGIDIKGPFIEKFADVPAIDRKRFLLEARESAVNLTDQEIRKVQTSVDTLAEKERKEVEKNPGKKRPKNKELEAERDRLAGLQGVRKDFSRAKTIDEVYDTAEQSMVFSRVMSAAVIRNVFQQNTIEPGKRGSYIRTKTQDEQVAEAKKIYAEAQEVIVKNLIAVHDSVDESVRVLSKLWYDGANLIAQRFAKEYGTTLEQAAGILATQSPQMPWFDNVHLAQALMEILADEGEREYSEADFDFFVSKVGEYPEQKKAIPGMKALIGTKMKDMTDLDAARFVRSVYEREIERRSPTRIPSGTIVAQEKKRAAFGSYDTIAKGVSIFRDGSSENIFAMIGNANKVRNFYVNIANPQDERAVTIDTHAMAIALVSPLASGDYEVNFSPPYFAFYADAYREAGKRLGLKAREVQSITWEAARAIFPAEEKKKPNYKTDTLNLWRQFARKELSLDEVHAKIFNRGQDPNITEWSDYSKAILDARARAEIFRRVRGPLRDTDAADLGTRAGTDSGIPALGRADSRGDAKSEVDDAPLLNKAKTEPSEVVAKLSREVLKLERQQPSKSKLIEKAEFEVRDGILFVNPHGAELLRVLTEEMDGLDAGSFVGQYMTPRRTERMEAQIGIERWFNPLTYGDSVHKLKKFEDAFAEAIDPEYWDAVIVVGDETNSVTIEEESAHRADLRLRDFLLKNYPDMTGLGAFVNAARAVRAEYGNVSEAVIFAEVTAKMFRTDAEEQLFITSEEIDVLHDAYGDFLFDTGVETTKVEKEFSAVQTTASAKFIERYKAKDVERTGTRERRDLSGNSKDNTAESKRGEDYGIEGSSLKNDAGRGAKYDAANESAGAVRQGSGSGRAGSVQGKPGAVKARERTGVFDPFGIGNERAAGQIIKTQETAIGKAFAGDKELIGRANDELLLAKAHHSPEDTFGKKVFTAIIDAANIPRGLKSSLDLSAPLRQGAVLTLSEPKLAAKAFVKQLLALNKSNYDRFVRDLDLHPVIELAEESGLYLSTLADQNLSSQEEAFMSRLLSDDKYFDNKYAEGLRKALTTHVRVSERAYKTYLDDIRINSFAKLAAEVHEFNVRKGQADDPEQYKGLASFINKATGRGDLGMLESAAPVLNATFFSPKYLLSRLQLLSPRFYAKLPPGVRRIAIRKMLQFVGATSLVMLLLKLAGGEIELEDNESGDFLKIRFGKFTYDMGAGFVQPIRLISRLIESAADKKTRGQKELGLISRFVRSKLAPVPGSVVNLYQGKDFIGKKVTAGSEAKNLVLPMLADDIGKAYEAEKEKGLAKLVPAVFGIGVGIYDKRGKK